MSYKEIHEANHDSMKYTCPCGYRFENYILLHKHSAVRHKNLLNDQYEQRSRKTSGLTDHDFQHGQMGSLARTLNTLYSSYLDFVDQECDTESTNATLTGSSTVETMPTCPPNNMSVECCASDDSHVLDQDNLVPEAGSYVTVLGNSVQPDYQASASMEVNSLEQNCTLEERRNESDTMISSEGDNRDEETATSGVPDTAETVCSLADPPEQEIAPQVSLPNPSLQNNGPLPRESRINSKNLNNSREMRTKLSNLVSVNEVMKLINDMKTHNLKVTVENNDMTETRIIRIEGPYFDSAEATTCCDSRHDHGKRSKNESEHTYNSRTRLNNTRPVKNCQRTQRSQSHRKLASKVFTETRKESRSSARTRHGNNHNSRCPKCSRTFHYKIQRDKHIEAHDKMIYRCPVCPYRYSNFMILQVHHTKSHGSRLNPMCRKNYIMKRKVKVTSTIDRGRKQHKGKKQLTNERITSSEVKKRNSTAAVPSTIAEGVVRQKTTVTLEEGTVPYGTENLTSLNRRCITGRLHRYRVTLEPEFDSAYPQASCLQCECSRGSRSRSRPIIELDLENVEEIDDINTTGSGYQEQSDEDTNVQNEDEFSESREDVGNGDVRNTNDKSDEENKPVVLQTSSYGADVCYYNIR